MFSHKDDVTHIVHANECACSSCRKSKGGYWRIYEEPEPLASFYNPFDDTVYKSTVKVKFKEYRLNWRFIGDDAVEYRYELVKEGEM